jgi:hypothetical protein
VWNEAFLHSYCHITRFHADAAALDDRTTGRRSTMRPRAKSSWRWRPQAAVKLLNVIRQAASLSTAIGLFDGYTPGLSRRCGRQDSGEQPPVQARRPGGATRTPADRPAL